MVNFKDRLKNPIYIILFVAFLLRMLFFFITAFTKGYDGFAAPDTGSYADLAEKLISWNILTQTSHITRTPGYPLYLSVMMLLLRDNYWIGVILGQIIFSIAGIYFFFKTTKVMELNSKVSFITAVLMAISPINIKYCNSILSDSITQFTLIIAFYFMVKYLKSIRTLPKIKDYICACVFLMISLLIRPSVVYLPLCIAIGVLFLHILYKNWNKIFCVLLSTLLICYTPVFLWSARNEAVSGHNTYTSISSINAYEYNAAYVYAEQNDMDYYEAHELLGQEMSADDVTKTDYYKGYSQKSLDIILSDIPTYLEGCLKGVGCLFVYPGLTDMGSSFSLYENLITAIKSSVKASSSPIDLVKNILALPIFDLLLLFVLFVEIMILLLLFITGIYGVIRAVAENRNEWYIPIMFVGILLYMVFVHMQPVGIGAYSRFRLIFEYIVIMFGAVGFTHFTSKKHHKIKA